VSHSGEEKVESWAVEMCLLSMEFKRRLQLCCHPSSVILEALNIAAMLTVRIDLQDKMP